MGPRPAAAATAAPALEPPEVMPGFQGLRVMPVSGLSPSAFHPNSGVVVLPIMMPPAPLSRRTKGASTSVTRCSKMQEPAMVRTPLVNARSLMVNGMPWSGPSTSPRAAACSARRAVSSADSAMTAQKALSFGFALSPVELTRTVLDRRERLLADQREEFGGRRIAEIGRIHRVLPADGGISWS